MALEISKLGRPAAHRCRCARSPRRQSALPRLFWVLAQSSGTRSRVRSLSASRQAATASSSFAVPLSRVPRARSALPQIVLCPGPLERYDLAALFLQRVAIGHDGLFEPRRSALAASEDGKRKAQIVLRPGPIERHVLAGFFLQRLAISRDRLFELCRPDLALPEPPKYKAEVGLGPGPIERHALACPFLQRLAVGRD